MAVIIIPCPRIDTSKITEWSSATKTKAIFARAVNTLVLDLVSFREKFLLQTLEGNQIVEPGKVICMGQSRVDPWQVDAKHLFARYNVVDITPDGWLVCEPKPGVFHKAYQVTKEALKYCVFDPGDYHEIDHFRIWAKEGQGHKCYPHQGTQGLGEPEYEQMGKLGDWILMSNSDPADVWIVRKDLFNATYVLQETV